MGILDAIQAEDKVEVKFSTFYEMMKGCTERQLLTNAVKANVPHRYIREMLTGVAESCDVLYENRREESSNGT